MNKIFNQDIDIMIAGALAFAVTDIIIKVWPKFLEAVGFGLNRAADRLGGGNRQGYGGGYGNLGNTNYTSNYSSTSGSSTPTIPTTNPNCPPCPTTDGKKPNNPFWSD